MTVYHEEEKQICDKAVDCLIAAGYALAVDYGEDYVTEISTDADTIKLFMGEADEEWLLVFRSPIPEYPDQRPVSSVYFVYGEGTAVLTDHGMSISAILAPANRLARTLSGVKE